MALAKKPITFKNAVNPLTWNVPIVNKDGSPTTEFQQKWLQQAATNASIVNLTTAAGVSAVLDLITVLAGSLLVRGTTRWQGLPSPADATMFLNGAAAPAFAKVKDTDLAVTDVLGNNVSITAHGFAPKAPNDITKYLDGTGGYSTPPTGGTVAASIYDDGTNIYLAVVDSDEQLVLDASGFGVYIPEVFPRAAIPATPYLMVSLGANQNLVSGANTKIAFDTVTQDNMSWWSTVNKNYVPLVAGRYFATLGFIAGAAPFAANDLVQATIFKNAGGVAAAIQAAFGAATNVGVAVAGAVIQCNGTTDAISGFAFSQGTTPFVNGAAPPSAVLCVTYLGP